MSYQPAYLPLFPAQCGFLLPGLFDCVVIDHCYNSTKSSSSFAPKQIKESITNTSENLGGGLVNVRESLTLCQTISDSSHGRVSGPRVDVELEVLRLSGGGAMCS